MSNNAPPGQIVQPGLAGQQGFGVPGQPAGQPVQPNQSGQGAANQGQQLAHIAPAGHQSQPLGIADHVGAHITALTLRGMQFAATQLLGASPMPVLRQFKMWKEGGKNGLPRVFVAYYSALEPLGLGRPTHPAIPVIELLLYAEISDSNATKAALKAALTGSKRAMVKGVLPTPQNTPGLSPDHGVSINELVNNVKNFWRLYAKICQQVRDYVVAGDLHSAIVVFRRNELEIKEVIDRIETSSTALANMYGRTSRARIDTVLGPILLPTEYEQPNLKDLTAVRTPHPVQSASLIAGTTLDPAAPAPVANKEAFEQTTQLQQIVPKPEPTAISTSFDVQDDVDAAAMAFVHKNEEGIHIISERRTRPQPGNSTSLGTIAFIGISLTLSALLSWYVLFAHTFLPI